MRTDPCKLCVLDDGTVGHSPLIAALTGRQGGNGVLVVGWTDPASGCECQLWDNDGRSMLDSLGQAYLADVDGYLIEVDGSADDAIAVAESLLEHASRLAGERPAVILVRQPNPAAAAPASRRAPVYAADVSQPERVAAALADLLARMGSQV